MRVLFTLVLLLQLAVSPAFAAVGGGFVFSQGKGENVSTGSAIASSAIQNNYLDHKDRQRSDELIAVYDEFLLMLARCRQQITCFIPPSLIQALNDAGYTNHGLNVGLVGLFELARLPVLAELNSEINALREKSVSNTKAMLAACAMGPASPACRAHLETAQEFLDWQNEGFFNHRGLVTVSSATLSQDFEYGRNLDKLIVQEMGSVARGEQTVTDAYSAIVTRAARYDGGVNIVLAGLAAGGVVLTCLGSSGATCGLAAAAAVAGQGDEAVDGVLTVSTGKPVQNPTEASLIAMGVSPENADKIEDWIERGATVIELGGGLVIAVKGGKLIGEPIQLNPGRERWSRDFGPVVKVDRMTRETIQNEETKEPFA